MTDNVVILTWGLSGSSVLAGLLNAAGYWTGTSTFAKPDYNTYENVELVELNRDLMSRVGVGDEYTKYLFPEAVDAIACLEAGDRGRFERFIDRCGHHSPWLWKDPRLWMTIRFWERLLPAGGVRFLLLERELGQSWISLTQRRLIQSWAYTKKYHSWVRSSLVKYLESSGRPWLSVLYEDLIVKPELELERLSQFLGLPITMDHLTSTYRGALYRRNKGLVDGVEAGLIYAKNFGERLK